jgi:O-phospho-L-seryl-tRNASec:L-selenocysteinyl-tRNA synthase
VLLLPLATGMAISLSLLTLAESRPERKYVLWSRIDQKTCLKSIVTANLIPVCIEL